MPTEKSVRGRDAVFGWWAR